MADRRAPLQLLPAPEDRDGIEAEVVASAPASSAEPGRSLAPGAPPSPGPVPLELAQELRMGEPVVWWGRKEHIDRAPIAWMAVAGLGLLGLASLLAPELWSRPLTEVWNLPLLALAPALLLLTREWFSQRAVLVTDSSVVVRDHRGRVDRLAFRNVRRVRRDVLTGGVLLEGVRHKLRLPPRLAEDARAAIATQTRHTLRGSEGPEDRIGWLP